MFEYYFHIDLYDVYRKSMVQNIIYENKYRDHKLNSIASALLNEGKLENLDGVQIQKVPKEKQLEYVIQDARLVLKLAQHNNYEILDLMNAISEITGIDFVKVCHTGLGTWWKNIILDKIASGECRSQPNEMIEKRKYAGGYVIKPAPKYYIQPVYVLDVKSLYPTMMINHNISFDTVNCSCCRNNPDALVPQDVMNLINENLPAAEKRSRYWICQNPNYIGIVPRLLSKFRDKRFKQQELGNHIMQLALKNLINGVYGLFGAKFFEFSDYRVAELTTAYGRKTLQYMQHVVREIYGFDVIYGDTDSIFVTNVKDIELVDKFIADCWIVEEVEIEVANVYKKFLITKKKHYIGIPEDNSREPEIKGMEGIKRDRPEWINKIERQLANDLKNDLDPTINIKKEFNKMEQGDIATDQIGIKLTLRKDPKAYPYNSLQRIVGSESNCAAGDGIKYYKSYTAGGGSSNPNLVSRRKYLEMLRTTVEDSLKVMGYDYFQDIVGYRKLDNYNK